MVFQKLTFDKDAILRLYNRNQWTNYTKDPVSLFDGIAASLYCYGAYEDDQLIGLIRVVGDGRTIVYIQDILVDPAYQRQGIGTKLMRHVLHRYSEVRQIILSTDNTPQQRAFYESLGFVSYDDAKLVGFHFPNN